MTCILSKKVKQYGLNSRYLYTMERTLVILTCFYLPYFSVYSLNFKNNACPNLYLYHVAPFAKECYENPDVLSDVPTMTKRNGYNIDTYEITTKDGYKLSLFSISGKTKATKTNPIYMQHGLTVNSGHYVDLGNRSCAFYFVERGYQVWLGNVRGSTYSKKHVNMTTHDPLFWTYNLDSIVEEDLPALLSFVYNKSGQKIHYIGDSFGTTVGMMFASSHEKASELLQSVFLLGPAIYVHNIEIAKFARPALVMTDILIFLGVRGLFYQDMLPEIGVRTCKLLPELCFEFIRLASGTNKLYPSEDLLLFFSYWPDGMSIYEFKQYLQIVISNKFKKFDYGHKQNLKKYGSPNPPLYNLSRVNVPVCILYGEDDQFYSKEDIDRTYNEIGTSKKCKYSIKNEKNIPYGHLDFAYSKTVVKDVFDVILNVLNRFES